VTDRDDALRRELGWTGSEDTDYEPVTGPQAPAAAPPSPVPPRPPVEPVPPSAAASNDHTPPEPQAPVASPLAHAPDVEPRAETPPAASTQEIERPRAPSRDQPTAQYGPPPGRDIRQPPPGPHRQDGGWGQQPQQPQPGWQQQRGPRPPTGPNQPPFGGPTGYGADPRVAPQPPGSYADRIRVNDLVPARRIPPARGWRRVVFKATFGLVNPGPSAEEIRQAELEAKVRGVLRGHFKVGVMGKGGVGKTTVSASIGSVFAELRQDDRVVAVDADTAFGKLGSRVDPRAQGSYWELASDKHLETFADVRGRVGNNSAGLFVLAGEGTPARRRVLDPAIYREATARLDRYFSISIVDCSSTMDTPVTQEVLRDLDALVVVSSPWVDGAAAAGQTMDWLANRGMTGLLQRTVVVLNDSDGHADKRTRSILAQQFAGQGQAVVEVPFDGHLRPGGVIDGTSQMTPAARRRFVEVAAALAEHFPTHDDRNRERR
jgi:MinD-like ATPase involved in chromosome partitioning or flagellar assembly